MPTKLPPAKRRLALAQLSRDRLKALTEAHGLDVGDRRVFENHVDALVRSRSVGFGDILRQLKREELQSICDALGVDRSGREKEALVERILGEGNEMEQQKSAPRNRGSSRTKNDAVEQASPTLPSGKLTVDQLERYLWSAADILRGSIDSSDYKHYI